MSSSPRLTTWGNPVTYYINNINTLPIGPVYDSTASAFYIAGEAAHAFEGGFRVFAKAGLNFWKHEAHFSTGSRHTDGTDPLFGAGAEYRRAPTSPFKFRAEWLRLLQEDDGVDRDTRRHLPFRRVFILTHRRKQRPPTPTPSPAPPQGGVQSLPCV